MESSTDVTASQTSAGSASTTDKNGLTAPSRVNSKANNSSTNSIASSDFGFDGSKSIRSSDDSAMDRLASRGSEDGYSEAGSTRRRMSKLFKSRRRRRKSDAQDDPPPVPQVEASEPAPPLPDTRPLLEPFQSEESLGLHKSAASSLITEDSDSEA